MYPMITWLVLLFGLFMVLYFLPRLLGVVYIPHSRVGIIEKLWSSRGSLSEGRIIAARGEAGMQSRLLRGGIHFGLFPWQYRIHKAPLVTVAEGRIGYNTVRAPKGAHRLRRVAPHCMVVNLVRSGRKQPQRFSASAGGTARHPVSLLARSR